MLLLQRVRSRSWAQDIVSGIALCVVSSYVPFMILGGRFLGVFLSRSPLRLCMTSSSLNQNSTTDSSLCKAYSHS